MAGDPVVGDVASALQAGVGALVRRLRQIRVDGEPTPAESSALAQLDRGGPATSAELARLEQISPQSMGATLTALQARGLVSRRDDPNDGRRAVVSITTAGLRVRRSRRDARTQVLVRALSEGFTRSELKVLATAAPLIERLAQQL
jgi:DNA-binding MarR family transcriptional regulator